MKTANNYTCWKPNPGMQELFLSCGVDEVFYGGAAGGGKSESLLVDSLRGVGKGGYKALLLRRTFPDLERSLIQRSHELIPQITHNKARYDTINHKWIFPNNDILQFGHCKTPKDVQNYQSAQYQYIGFDELTHFEENMYLTLFTRLRSTDRSIRCYMRGASNPGSIGHGWVKKRFIDKLKPCEIKFYKNVKGQDIETNGRDLDALSRCWIPAGLKDNPKLPATYEAALNQLPENLQRAYKLGDWSILTGQYFTEFQPSEHIIAPFEIPDHWGKYISFDPGYNDPCCALWFAVSPSGHHFCYREYYTSKVLARDQAKTIKKLTGSENIQSFIAGRDLWNKYSTGGRAAVEEFNREGLYPIRANTDRLQGWNRVHQMLALANDDKPKCMIFNICTNLIRSLPSLSHDTNRPEDVAKHQEDHAPDAFRYYAISTVVDEDIKPRVDLNKVVNGSILKLPQHNEEEDQLVWDTSTGYLQ